MSDKRSFPRLAQDWEIEWSLSKSESLQPVLIKSVIRDLSMGGFRFKSESACPPKSLLHFAINPKESLKPMVGVARIAWTRDQNGIYENGAQFIWVSWKGMDPQTAIGQYVVDHISEKPS
jgi:hypothetical protein